MSEGDEGGTGAGESEGGLGVSAGRYPEWQASTAQLAVSRFARRGEREAQREKRTAHVYVHTECVLEIFGALLESRMYKNQTKRTLFRNKVFQDQRILRVRFFSAN